MNPQIGEDLMLDARRGTTFRCSGVLRDKIEGRGKGRTGYLLSFTGTETRVMVRERIPQ